MFVYWRLICQAAMMCVLAILLSSCASQSLSSRALDTFPTLLGVDAQAEDNEEQVIRIDLLAVDDRMQYFIENYVQAGGSSRARLEQLVDLIYNPAYLGLDYVADANFGAQTAFARREANCLSFSALVIALARQIGVDARFQHVPMVPSWRRSGDTFLVEQHVNVSVKVLQHHYVIDFEPPDNVSSRMPRVISDEQAEAMLLGNLGAELLSRGEPEEAYRYFRSGLLLDPNAEALWLNLGVSLARAGFTEHAERAYLNALDISPGNLSALNNLLILRRAEGEDTVELEQKLKQRRDRNPYYMYWQAEQWMAEDKPQRAEKELKKAIKLRPDEADFYVLLAESEMAQGNMNRAISLLEEAVDLASSNAQRARIYKRLSELSADQNS